MGLLWFQRELPAWLEAIARRLDVTIDAFDPRGVTTRHDPLVVLIDTREGDPKTVCRDARAGFGHEAVIVALTGLEGLDSDASQYVDVSAPASSQVVVPVLRLASSLADERRLRAGAESKLAHAKQRTRSSSSSDHRTPISDLGQAALAQSRLGLMTFDTDLRCTGWNGFLEQTLGVKAELVLGKRPSEIEPLISVGVPFERIVRGVLASGPVDTGELRTTDAAGKPRWLHLIANPLQDDTGGPLGVVAILRDLTPQRMAEELRRETEREFRALLDALPDAAFVHVAARVVFANRTAATMFGWAAAAELVGHSILELVHPDDRKAVEQRVAAVIADERVPPQEVRFLHNDGTTLVVEISSIRVTFGGEKASFCVVRDVTERKVLQGRIATTDRLASMGVLAAGVGHEINNPLTALVSSLDFLDEEVDALPGLSPESDVHDLLLTAKEAAYRIRDIVRDLRLFSRPDEERRGYVDVRATLDSTARLARVEIRHRARLVKDFRPVPLVEGNEARFGQVFLNLVMNAAQAIAEGDIEKNEITLATSTDADGNAVIEVTDTGKGIPESHLNRVFEPFFTTKPVGVGTGLGLSISQRIITGAGGKMEVSSEIGKGTKVRVLLPPAKPRGVPITARPMPGEHRKVRGRVLVVDDDVAVRRALIRMLSEEHDVVTVSSGAEAIETIQSGERFDVVLCDLMMPRVTGDKCYERVSSFAPDQAERFVFMTGGAFTPSARAFIEQMQNPLIEKPFDVDALRATVRALVATNLR